MTQDSCVYPLLGSVSFRKVQLASFTLLICIAQSTNALGAVSPSPFSNSTRLDQLWVLIAAGLVFLMQAGFSCFESGMVRRKNMTATALKNTADWLIVCVCFFLFGFGFMYGDSFQGLIGTDSFWLSSISDRSGSMDYLFFLFQLAFAGTALTIVSGALTERTGFVPYVTGAIMMSLFIYPVYGHWAWGECVLPRQCRMARRPGLS